MLDVFMERAALFFRRVEAKAAFVMMDKALLSPKLHSLSLEQTRFTVAQHSHGGKCNSKGYDSYDLSRNSNQSVLTRSKLRSATIR
jgi:hypothetical protein